LITVPTDRPGLVLRCREADGEYYVYVEDVAKRRLAGYTVFNRLTEVGRRVDPHVRAPHSKYALAYQRQGLCSGIYRWALDAGLCLLGGARQSEGAHALWRSLQNDYAFCYVQLRQKRLRRLGALIDAETRDRLETRMLLASRR